MTRIMVNLDRSEAQGEPITEQIGPFAYVQITYDGISCWITEDEEGPEFFNGGGGMWYPKKSKPIGDSPWVSSGPDLSHHGWTDLTIWPVTTTTEDDK